ncbi:MAG: amino acid-binding protein [Methanocellales archaeon]|nr:amino acid-binding protein [Methanocellales archaeon]
MRVTMDLELKDMPGQLVLALQPISEFGGNIVSVIHHRDKKTPRGLIPVQITFEIDEGKLEGLINRMKSDGVTIVQVGEDRLLERVVVILIGHIIHSDIRDTIDRIDSTGYAEVKDLAVSMPGVDQHSAARMVINATGKKEMKKAIQLLRNVAHEKNLLLIEPI